MEMYSVILTLLRGFLAAWDFVTWPIYQAIYKPWEVREKRNRVRAKPIKKTQDEIIYESVERESELYEDMERHKVDTMSSLWKWAAKKYSHRELLGTRDILREEDEVQSNGKIFKKLHLGEYRWISYEGADTTSDLFGKGLRSLGLHPKANVCIYADTRSEWFLSAIACFQQGFPLCTIYTNLGEEAVVHGINQTKSTHIITTHDLLPKFKGILQHTPTVTHVVYFEDQVKSTPITGFPGDPAIVPFWDVVSRGKKVSESAEVQPVTPGPTDIGIIMYTSGSTGVPKGVMLSQRNLFNSLKSFALSIEVNCSDYDTYIAFLPLAHVLEMLCEMLMVIHGVRIGYSGANTMMDSSSMIKKGYKGDAALLRPTFMAGVPLILDRIYKVINSGLAKKGEGFERLFKFCYEYRRAAVANGEETPIMDFLVFRSLRKIFGGRLKFIATGGAPLSPETHEFVRTVMGCPILQAYGLTETCANTTAMDIHDNSTGAVGPPNQGVHIKLVNWEEGNYRVTDQPRPRGEVVVGAASVSEGYYLMPEKTEEEFTSYAHARRWFKTGDIGEFQRDGTLKIIDRKKDLVKLQFGEYVSLGKVEAVLKTCPVVDNVCIYGESSKSYTVALCTPDRATLAKLASKFGKEELSFEDMCDDMDVTGAALRELVNHSKKFGLEKFEIPGAVTLCKDMWDIDSGYVTSAFKLKRKPIQDKYQKDIDRMYGTSRSGA